MQYQNKQKSLEWTSERGLLLPSRLTTQGSLNVILKEDIVNQKTPNFSLSERRLAFTENQQEFLKELVFTNSVDENVSLQQVYYLATHIVVNTSWSRFCLQIIFPVMSIESFIAGSKRYKFITSPIFPFC